MKSSNFISTLERAWNLNREGGNNSIVCNVVLKGGYVIEDIDLCVVEEINEDELTSIELLSCNRNYYTVELEDVLTVSYYSIG